MDDEVGVEGVLEKGFDVAQGSGSGTGAGAAGALVMNLHHVSFDAQYIESTPVVGQGRSDGLIEHRFNDESFFLLIAAGEVLLVKLVQNRFGFSPCGFFLVGSFVKGDFLFYGFSNFFKNCVPAYCFRFGDGDEIFLKINVFHPEDLKQRLGKVITLGIIGTFKRAGAGCDYRCADDKLKRVWVGSGLDA